MTPNRSPSPKVAIYIATCDRWNLLAQTIQSCLNQDYDQDYIIVVSDNSSNDFTEINLKGCTSNIKYIRRKPQLHPINHLNQIIKECDADYLTIFHDDDILDSGYIKQMCKLLAENQDVCAVGCNAYYLLDKKILNEVVRKSLQPEKITKPEALVTQYVTINSSGPPPFSSYMYRMSKIRCSTINNDDAGKYSDLAYLVKLLKKHPILWCPVPLMWYRIHSGNDTKGENIGQRLRLTRFIYLNTSISRKSRVANEMRFLNLYRWYKARRELLLVSICKNPNKGKVVLKYLLRYALTSLLINYAFWRKILRKKILNEIS